MRPSVAVVVSSLFMGSEMCKQPTNLCCSCLLVSRKEWLCLVFWEGLRAVRCRHVFILLLFHLYSCEGKCLSSLGKPLLLLFSSIEKGTALSLVLGRSHHCLLYDRLFAVVSS